MENPKQLLLQQWLQKLPPADLATLEGKVFVVTFTAAVQQQLPHGTKGLGQLRLGLWLWSLHVPLWGFSQI